MKGQIEAVILDWAGTTVDYGCFAPVQAFVEVFREFHLEPTMEEIRKPMGMLKWDHIHAVLSMSRIADQFRAYYGRDFEKEDVDRMYSHFETGLMGILHNFAELKPHVLETVWELRNRGIKIGSTTGYTDSMMEVVVKRAKEQGYEPDVWYSPDSTDGMGRPYPYMIFRNMMDLKVSDVSRVIKIGDTVSDILEGKQAGVTAVGIIEGSSEMGLTEEEYESLSHKEKEEHIRTVTSRYQEAGADHVVMDIRGILGLV